MTLIDTHTHLYVDAFDEDRDMVIQNAINEGVDKFFLPNIDLESVAGMHDLVRKYPTHCYPMMGLHPCSVDAHYKTTLDTVEQYISNGEVPYYAIGEIGIDLYWDKTHKAAQMDAFKIQIEWAKALNLPIVIHVRDAFDEVFEVVDQHNDDALFGIFHCFTGDLNQAQKVIDYGGFKLGLGGVLTFKNSGLDKVIQHIDMQHLVLETDSPYLAPTPKRGKRNESKYLLRVAEKLADIHQISLEDVAKITSENALAIFDIPTT